MLLSKTNKIWWYKPPDRTFGFSVDKANVLILPICLGVKYPQKVIKNENNYNWRHITYYNMHNFHTYM